MSPTVEGIRTIEVKGGFNLRDFGGYPTTDGRRVKRGLLFRSGTMAMLESEDIERLRALGIRTICDLRHQSEREMEPTRWHEGAAGIEYWARDHHEVSGVLSAVLRDERADGRHMRDAMIAMYRQIPFDHAEAYRTIFQRLVAAEGPLLINCSAGKDRTGCGAALILLALGVSREDVMRDYLATNLLADWQRIFVARDSILGQLNRTAPDRIEPMLRAEADYLEAMFETLEERHGGIPAYLAEELQVDAGSLDRIRDFLLEQ